MALVEHYLQIRQAHLSLVLASGGLFAFRGAVVLSGRPWAMAPTLRRASMAIDTLLLAAGATLWTLLGLNPARELWLGVKLLALLVYIVLGTFALRRGRTPGVRAACYIAALAVFGFIASVALTHRPLGLLQRWPA